MTLQQLRYLIAVSEQGSINAAAQSLYVSQSSLSTAIKELERELGIVIFTRTNRGVTLTNDGTELLGYARQVVEQADMLEDRYARGRASSMHLAVSTQHYSFAVKAFIQTANEFGLENYEFAIHETKTHTVMSHVRNMKSELGVLYLNDFNREALTKIFHEYGLEFHPLFDCSISVYLCRKHPLAKKKTISIEELQPYPCLSFEQGDYNSFYFAEEVLSTYEYKKVIKADDRATLLNLMVGLDAFTLCSGIITEDLNGSEYVAVPLESKDRMTIGYIKKARVELTDLGRSYIENLKRAGASSAHHVS